MEYGDRFDKIDKVLESMDKKLFRDNGGECVQSKLNRHDEFIERHDARAKSYNKRLWAIIMLVIAQFVGYAVWLLK